MIQTDIRTVETVEIDDEARVRVAKREDGSHEAAVVAVKREGLSRALHEAVSFGDDPSPWESLTDAPRVTAEGQYEAAGLAVERYIDDLLKEAGVDAETGGPTPDGSTPETDHPAASGFSTHGRRVEFTFEEQEGGEFGG